MNRQDYLDGKISFEDYYRGLAKEHHIGNIKPENFGVTLEQLKLKYAADKNLNNIPLARFDSITASYNAFNPHTRLTLADGCCIYKTLLVDLIEVK